MLSQACHLRAEIEFWRDMIERDGTAVSAEALGRMRQALELAERKLLMLDARAPDTEGRSGVRNGLPPASDRRH